GCNPGFLDFRDGIVPAELEVEMRHVRQLVSRDDEINDRGPVDGEGLGDRAAQLVRLSRLETMAAASAGKRGEIRIWEFDRLPERRQTLTLGFQNNESKARIVVDHALPRQLGVPCRQELANQHVETAVTGQGDDLPRAVERLDAVRLT